MEDQQTQTPAPDAVETPEAPEAEEPKALEYEEIVNASPEQLEKMTVVDGEEGEPDKVVFKPEEPSEDDKKTVKEPEKEESEGDKKPEEAASEHAEDPEEELSGEELYKKRLKDTQSKLHEATSRTKELERRLTEVENQKSKAKFDSFEVLDNEALEALKEDDPDAYIKYHEDLAEHKQQKEEFEVKTQEAVEEAQWGEVVEYVKQVHEFDYVAEAAKDEEAATKRLKELTVDSDEFNKLQKYVLKEYNAGANGIFPVEKLLRAHRDLNFDSIIEETKVEARKNLAAEIEKAGSGGSSFDKIPPGSGKKGSGINTKELTMDQVHGMGYSQIKALDKELEVD